MKKISFLLSLLFILYFSFNVYSQVIPEGIKIISSEIGYTIEFVNPDYKISQIKGGSEDFSLISNNSYGITADVGYPQLPSNIIFYFYKSK